MKVILEHIKKAPDCGALLAYTRKEVLFFTYASKEVAAGCLTDKEVLELHMFDEQKEFRMLESKSKRYAGENGRGVICAEVELTQLPEAEIFREEVFLEQNGDFCENSLDSIIVLNQVAYDDNGMAAVVNYQLVLPKEVQYGRE